MTKKERTTLFNLVRKLYKEEVKKSGMLVLPYVWAKNGEEMVVASMFGKQSDKIERLLGDNYDNVCTKIWCIKDTIDRAEGRITKKVLQEIKEYADAALMIMEEEEYL